MAELWQEAPTTASKHRLTDRNSDHNLLRFLALRLVLLLQLSETLLGRFFWSMLTKSCSNKGDCFVTLSSYASGSKLLPTHETCASVRQRATY